MIERKLIEEAVVACTKKNVLKVAEEAAIYTYINNLYGDISVEELETDLFYYETDPTWGFLDCDDDGGYRLRWQKEGR